MRPMRTRLIAPTFALLLAAWAGPAARAAEGEDGWIELIGDRPFEAWRAPTGAWEAVGEVRLDPENPKRLAVEPGSGIIYNGPTGRTGNLISKESFGDVELHAEFCIPKGSNSGVKFGSLYEIQILDSHGKDKVGGTDCGGIYPKAELLPRYRYLDEGHAPRVNACRAPGEWQTLDAVFRAPRFDADGKKVADARLEKAVLNGEVIHEGVDLAHPTGHNWTRKESPAGPLLLQADHGPVAFRNLRIRRLPPADSE